MTLLALLGNPAFPRALVLGAFGGVGLVLTAVYSRRGPLILPVYAALLAAAALLLVRYPGLTFGGRLAAGLAGFLLASTMLYVAVGILAGQDRRRLIAEGRLPAEVGTVRLSLWGHAWRLGFVAIIGSVVCAGVAFVTG